MIQNCNFVATFWSVFNIMKLKHPRPTTGKHGFVCVFHYSPNCFIIPRTHSFGFLIRDQFHPIGKQFSDKLQSAVSRLPVSARSNVANWQNKPYNLRTTPSAGMGFCHVGVWFILVGLHKTGNIRVFLNQLKLNHCVMFMILIFWW